MKVVSPKVDFPKLETEVLDFWKKDRVFQQSLEKKKDNDKVFTFYDGPPFANGLPHYGHLLANIIKDIVPRYWTMRGYLVERNFGWDCHGFPVESEIEKNNDLKGHKAIVEFGVGKFNEECRASVTSYAKQWQETIDRIGRWVSWDNQYHTMDKNYMESVWWVFSRLFEKGHVYQGHKIVAYSPRNATVVSNFEANQNYKEIQDPAVTIKVKVKGKDDYLLIWTTTPWTLPSNLAIAVHPELEYLRVKNTENQEVYVIAEARLGAYQNKKKTSFEVIEKISGRDLIGLSYEPIFDYFKDQPNAFKVILADYVTATDGTGLVHQAPAFGEDDFQACRKNNIEMVDPLDVNGVFDESAPDFKGMFVKDADKEIMKVLKEKNRVLKHDTLVHSYPFCDRTDTPLIYRAIPAWYVNVESFKENLVDNNLQIRWVPGHLQKGRMGKWLENARDWAISRNRFWGTPLPVWVCDKSEKHKKVFGSIRDLESLTGKKITDIHKHLIDDLKISCDQCDGEMKRIDEVFDCWFESGSMPYAQGHYPFENKESFDQKFPADFIAEGLDQTRGWFYTLGILSEALFGKPAFKNVIVNGIICDETGKKMSKRFRNYTPPVELLDKFGADSVRLYMINSPLLRGENLIFSDKGVKDTTRAVLLPLWNAYSFLTTYAEAEGWKPCQVLTDGQPPKVQHKMDRWLISKLQTLAGQLEVNMEEYKLYAVVPDVLSFIDDLTNWYIRLSHRRFWKVDAVASGDSEEAFATLYYALLQFSKILAPFAPFISEEIYQGLCDGTGKVSVHLCDIPTSLPERVDVELEREMNLVRQAAELGRGLRAKEKIKTRQPLQSITLVSSDKGLLEQMKSGASLLMGELNVKEVKYSTAETDFVDFILKPNLKILGKKLGPKLGDFRKSLNSLSDAQTVLMVKNLEGGKAVRVADMDFVRDDFLLERKVKGDQLVASQDEVTVAVDCVLTDQLVREGVAREFVNRIQNFRKDSGLNVSDRIRVKVDGSPKLIESIQSFKDYIASEVLANSLDIGPPSGHQWITDMEIEGETVSVGMDK